MDLSINEGTLVVTGGPGHSLQTAIVIKKTPKGLSAAGAELLLLTQRFGERASDPPSFAGVQRTLARPHRSEAKAGWTLKRQDLLQENGRVYDSYCVLLPDGTERMLYFDVTDFLAGLRR